MADIEIRLHELRCACPQTGHAAACVDSKIEDRGPRRLIEPDRKVLRPADHIKYGADAADAVLIRSRRIVSNPVGGFAIRISGGAINKGGRNTGICDLGGPL